MSPEARTIRNDGMLLLCGLAFGITAVVAAMATRAGQHRLSRG
jgi:hypothetical protein